LTYEVLTTPAISKADINKTTEISSLLFLMGWHERNQAWRAGPRWAYQLQIHQNDAPLAGVRRAITARSAGS
jgi:hypothetical protein